MSGTPRTIRPGYPPLKWSDMDEAFRDINQNFNDIYATIMSDGSTQVVNFSALYDDVSPAISNTYQLGDTTHAWKKVYVSEYIDSLGNDDNGIWLGTAQIRGAGGIIDLPANSTINGELIIDPSKTYWDEIQVDDSLNLLPTGIGAVLELNSGTGMQLVVDSSAGSITFNNNGVTQLTAGAGISLDGTTGDITVTNSGVTSLTNTASLPAGRTTGTGIHVDSSTGAVKITNTGIVGITTTYGMIISTDAVTGISTVNWDPSVGISAAFSRIRIDGDSILNDIQAGPSASTLTLVEGNGISFATDPVTDKLTISISRGDLVGSIFGDDSSKIVDAVESKVYAPNGFYGDLNGTLFGNVNVSTGQSNFNDIVIQGDLIVQGATTSVETTNIQITDNVIILNNGESGAGVTSVTSGIEIDRGSESNKTLVWDDSVDKWTVGTETFVAGTFQGNLSGNLEGTVTGELIGTVIGDVNGSVFADDSAIMVDAIDQKIYAAGGFIGDLTGNADGDHIGTFSGNVFSNLIDSSDSSEINIVPSVNCNSNLTVGGDILPNTDLGGDLGSPTQQWKSLYVSGSTIFIGGFAVSVKNGNLSVGSSEVQETLVSGTNIKTINGDSILGEGDLVFTGSGTVTSVSGTGTVNGLTLTGTVTSSGDLTLGGTLAIAATQVTSGTLAVERGGTGQTTYTNGQLLIGKTDGSLAKATLTAGDSITITNGNGTITIDSTGGTVTSVSGTGTVNGLTLTGTVTSSGDLTLGGTLAIAATQVTSGTLAVERGGTGQTTYTNGQLLIGNTTGGTLSKATLTAGTGIDITNGTGTITIAATNNGTVTSVGGTGTVNGLTLTGTVTSTGNLTLGGSLSDVSLTTQVSGTLPVANGGTGITSFGTGVATFLGTPSSSNLRAAITDETGTGALVFATSPTLVTPALGTPVSGNLSNCTVDGTNSVGFKNIPKSGSAKTTSYTLATGDVGKFIEVGSGGSITIPNATFAAGDVLSIFNNTTGNRTITCTITTAYIAGVNENKASVALTTRGICTILFISGTVCVISGNVS